LVLVLLLGILNGHAGREAPSVAVHFISAAAQQTVPVTLNGNTLTAVVAETDFTRARGLLGWNNIEDGQGMLLDFLVANVYAIHMQGMRFPIDAVWIDASGVVKLVYEDIQPNSGQVYPSMFPCRYCLEIKAGSCKKFGVKAGQTVTFGSPSGSTQ
jgi:uncharacterized membrane protein (UPF0127 family)